MCLVQNRKPLTVEEMYEDMSQVKNVIFHVIFPVDMCLNIFYHTDIGLTVTHSWEVTCHRSMCKDMYGKNSSTLNTKMCLNTIGK